MLIGYARVSTEDQDLDMPRNALARVGCERTFEDRRSGAKADRPGLAGGLEYARSGDSLVVWRLDRLGRSLSDLIALVRRMEETDVQLRSLTEGIDTSTINGKLTFHLFAALAEFERALMCERKGWSQCGSRPRPQRRPQAPALAQAAGPCRHALPSQGQDYRGDLPADGHIETYALRLRGRGPAVTTPAENEGPPMVMRLKVALLGVKPTVWRRIEVNAASTRTDLHVAIQR